MSSPRDFSTPEEAALAGWSRTTGVTPRVVSVDVRGDRAEVQLAVGPDYPDFVYVVRDGAGWTEVASGDGPTIGWDDPHQLHW